MPVGHMAMYGASPQKALKGDEQKSRVKTRHAPK